MASRQTLIGAEDDEDSDEVTIANDEDQLIFTKEPPEPLQTLDLELGRDDEQVSTTTKDTDLLNYPYSISLSKDRMYSSASSPGGNSFDLIYTLESRLGLEMVLHILGYLRYSDLYRLSRVCKLMRGYSMHPLLPQWTHLKVT